MEFQVFLFTVNGTAVYTGRKFDTEISTLNRFLSGLIIGVLLSVAAYYLLSHTDRLPPLVTPNDLGRCSGDSSDCRPNPGRYQGISGSARLSADSHLVVHDAHDGSNQASLVRLGIVKNTQKGPYVYLPISVGRNNWDKNGEVASDLEAACHLTHSDNEFLVAESGRVDSRREGKVTLKTWHGRIFHIEVYDSGSFPYAKVYKTPGLKLAGVSTPVFENLDPSVEEYPHSKENYEGLACLHLNPDTDEAAKYLLVLGERGGVITETGTLHWGLYDTDQPLATREITWNTSSDLQFIVAPGKRHYTATQWRDITGLHIDNSGRLHATAAYDTEGDNPPFDSITYQLGVICVDASDNHGRNDLCDYSAPPRPVVLDSYTISASSDQHKFESVSAPSGEFPKPGSLSIGAEDEDSSGAWWPEIPHH